MKLNKILALALCIALLAMSGISAIAEGAQDSVLSSPTDFKFDPYTGEFSFSAVDERTAYYFIRIYKVADGVEDASYTASSERIKGKTTGEMSGTVDLSSLGWGTYSAKLTSYSAAGSGLTSPEPTALTLAYGVGQTLERPEMMASYSGNRVEFVIDWITLSDYYTYQYMPYIKFTFYSDEALTQEVYSDTQDTSYFTKGGIPFGGDAWGYSVTEGNFLFSLPDVPEVHEMGGYDLGTPIYDIYYTEDNFGYQLEDIGLEPGDYYVTAQAVSRDEYVLDSQPSEALKITLSAEPFTAEHTDVTTAAWLTPWPWWSSPFVSTTVDYDRVDYAKYNPVSGITLSE